MLLPLLFTSWHFYMTQREYRIHQHVNHETSRWYRQLQSLLEKCNLQQNRILMILEALKKIWSELLELCEKVTPTTPVSLPRLSPSFIWFTCRAVSALYAYPKGLSRAVLLTELETKWWVEFATPFLPWNKMTSDFALPIHTVNICGRRAALRRGEHAGTLKQAILSGVLQTTDIIVGEFFFKHFLVAWTLVTMHLLLTRTQRHRRLHCVLYNIMLC